ncbi:MAG: 4Fe-4S binding protein [Desulfobacteraceae bacterium]|nr:Coenzyme F420 hydrogenase/dehydrogenase, beta subunit C-terminal domain [Desulfobacteraceae bacterium]MBC2754178.1 4Fe-4S binding protein [Desulfobacteraceae bacterium]
MANTSFLNVDNDNVLLSIQKFLKSILDLNDIEAILAPLHKKDGKNIMPVFIADPTLLNDVDPLAPAFAMNAAKLVSKLTHKPMGKKIAVVLRSCEIRALIELVKLKQAYLEDIVIIGFDCLGTYTNKNLAFLMASDTTDLTQRFCENALAGKEPPIEGGPNLSPACRACEYPVPENADILIGLLGLDIKKQVLLQALTEKGNALFENLSYTESEEPPGRKKVISEVISKKIEFRDKMFETTHKATNTLEKLSDYFASCINCYNCRVACPVCYCRECVFNTDVFDHDPYQYMQWAKRKGAVKLPADTNFYHITRLAHISLNCVGCGQCSNACPNDIPVMELFKYVANNTQAAFEYEAGKDMDQPPPLSVFKEEEYLDVVGIN